MKWLVVNETQHRPMGSDILESKLTVLLKIYLTQHDILNILGKITEAESGQAFRYASLHGE